MASESKNETSKVLIGKTYRSVIFDHDVQVADGVDAKVYAFKGDRLHRVAVYTVRRGIKTPVNTVREGLKVDLGFVKGKGTLTVNLNDWSADTYYFENEGLNKDVTVLPGQSYHWTATNDSDLEFYEVSDVPLTKLPNNPRPAPIVQAPPAENGPKVKLFLTSQNFSEVQSLELTKLAGKDPHNCNLALIENAADLESGSPKWVLQNRQMIARHGYNIELVDLVRFAHKPIGLIQKLRGKDIIWIGGGNTFYLRWLMRISRADEIITELVHTGTVYGGSSAGSVIVGPTLKYFESADDPAKAPETILEGLHLTATVVVPHMNQPGYADIMRDINSNLIRSGFKTAPLNDDQVLIVDGESQRIV